MLSFRRHQVPPPYLNRREQLRLLALVALLGFVLLAIKTAAEPSTWYWLLGQPADHGGTAQPTPIEGVGRSTTVLKTQPVEPASEPSTSPAESFDAPEALDRDMLSTVKDNALIAPSEREAYYHTLAYAARGNREVGGAPAADATFASLFNDPAAHRGELVALQGHVRRVTEFDAGPNPYGFVKLYEAWLFTAESGTNPYVVVCGSVPAGMPRGDGVLEEVRTEGYFFKKYAYRAGDGMRLAPLVLADRLVWLRSSPRSSSHSPATYLFGSAVAIVIGLGVSVWVFARTRQRFAAAEADRIAAPSPDELAALRELESPSEESPPFDGD